MEKRRPTSIDLFSGAGGMTLGFEQAGFNVLAAFDLEEWTVKTHRKNFPHTAAFTADLSKETGESLRELATLGDREIDLVFGGPPCQGFSVGGKRDLSDKRNLLVYDFARLVRQLRPKYFVMENVRGLMSSHSRPVLDSFLRRMKRAGYRLVEPIQVLNAADFGVPQRRVRAFIIGYRKGMSAPSYPSPRGCRYECGREYKPLVKDAISDLAKLDEHDKLFASDVFEGKLLQGPHFARLMRGLVKDEEEFSHPRTLPKNRLTGCLRTNHSDETVARFAATPPGGAEPVSRYIRLDWNGVAPTIRAGTAEDHGSHTAPRPIHPHVPRCISAREAARLHSLPDWFEFHGTRWHDFRLIGNAVPPLLARAVATQIIEAL